MKKYCCLLLLGILTLGGCQNIEQISIDYLTPAELGFPEQVKRVAVINNMPSDTTSNVNRRQDDRLAVDNSQQYRRTEYLTGDAKAATEALAETLADGNYFEEVITSDSTVSRPAGSAILSSEQVADLTRSLGADFLIAVENVQLRAVTDVSMSPFYGMYIGSTDVTVSPSIRLYFPTQGSNHPLVSKTDSIYWEGYSSTLEGAKETLVDKDDMKAQASAFAGSFIAQSIIPTWHTASRYYYAGGSVSMRDAAVSVAEDDWDEAIRLWKDAYNTKSEKKRMYAAFNLALGYEMTDSLDLAVNWCKEAQRLAAKVDGVAENGTLTQRQTADKPRYAMATFYLMQLEKRHEEMASVKMQMNRFKDNF